MLLAGRGDDNLLGDQPAPGGPADGRGVDARERGTHRIDDGHVTDPLDATGVHQGERVREIGVGVGVDEVPAEHPRQHEAGRVRPLERVEVFGGDVR